MFFRLLQSSLWTTLASERSSSICELLPDFAPTTESKNASRNRGNSLLLLGALAVASLGAAMFLDTAAQLFFRGTRPTATASSRLAGTLQPPDKKTVLMSYAAQPAGNAAAGKLVFMSKSCVACHDLPGAGGGMGPDLFGVGSRYSQEVLMKKILEPRVKSGMPTTFADELSPEEFGDLLAYLQDATPVRGDVQ